MATKRKGKGPSGYLATSYPGSRLRWSTTVAYLGSIIVLTVPTAKHGKRYSGNIGRMFTKETEYEQGI